MKGKGVKVTKFIKDFSLEVLHEGADMQEAMLTVSDLNRPGLQFQGFYDYFDPHRLQIIGRAEHMYLQGLCSEDRRKCFDDLFLYGIPALIISRELECYPECMDSAKTYGRTVLRSTETTVDFTSHVIEYLNRALAPYVTRHGVLMDVYGIGVLLMGDSGIGKSELAIDLIMRGHRLVSDDCRGDPPDLPTSWRARRRRSSATSSSSGAWASSTCGRCSACAPSRLRPLSI